MTLPILLVDILMSNPRRQKNQSSSLKAFLQKIVSFLFTPHKTPKAKESVKPQHPTNPIKNTSSLSVGDFEFIKVIGKGSFGKVILGRLRDDGSLYAIKVIAKSLLKDEADIRHIMSEHEILSSKLMGHPFLIKFLDSFQTDVFVFFVMQYVNGGELFYHLQRALFTEERAKFYAAEIVCAFAYLHSKNIVYRDLKPENILLDSEGHIVLIDFGLAKEVSKEHGPFTKTFCGTPEYIGKNLSLIFSPRNNSKPGPPFYSKSRKETFSKILEGPILFPAGSFSAPAKDFILKLLHRSPTKRLGSGPNGSENIKTHSFFRGIDWYGIVKKRGVVPFVPDVSHTEFGVDNIDTEFLNEEIPLCLADINGKLNYHLDDPIYSIC